MTTYFFLFFLFVAFSVWLKHFYLDDHVNSWPTLIGYGLAVVPLLLLLYFMAMFACTRGMKYFVARKPAIYNRLSKFGMK